ncbi:hypothetical protein ACFWQG_13005 [Rhodococcus sp. NPDC058532]
MAEASAKGTGFRVTQLSHSTDHPQPGYNDTIPNGGTLPAA